jgi:hypothetical protein
MWKHCVNGVQNFSFVKVNVVLNFAGVLATADHSFSSLVSLICSSGDLMVILTSVHIVTGEGNRNHRVFVSGFLATTAVRKWSFLLSS